MYSVWQHGCGMQCAGQGAENESASKLSICGHVDAQIVLDVPLSNEALLHGRSRCWQVFILPLSGQTRSQQPFIPQHAAGLVQ